MEYGAAILIIGLLALIESVIFILFPKAAISLGKRWFKTPNTVRKVAFVEFLIAIALILIGKLM